MTIEKPPAKKVNQIIPWEGIPRFAWDDIILSAYASLNPGKI